MGKKKEQFRGFIVEKKFMKLAKKTDFTSLVLYHDLDSGTENPYLGIEEWCKSYATGRVCYRVIEEREPYDGFSPDGTMRTEYRLVGYRHCLAFESADSAFAFKMRWA